MIGAIQKEKGEKGLYGEEVVNRRIRVYWPMDEEWYEGCVRSFDRVLGKHLVEYDDDEEELIDLSKEKIEWVEVEGGFSDGKLKRRRLRKVGVVVDDDEVEEREGNVGGVAEEDEEEDDSSDEDWGKNAVVEEKECCSEDVELVDEDEEEEEEVGSLKRKRGEIGDGGGAKRKRKGGEGGGTDTIKKTKKVEVKSEKPVTIVQGN